MGSCVLAGRGESKVMPPLSGVAAFAATRGRATTAATLATATAPGTIQGAPAFLLYLAFLADRVVDSAVQAKTGDLFSILIGRRYRAEPILGGRIIYEATNSSHGLGPL